MISQSRERPETRSHETTFLTHNFDPGILRLALELRSRCPFQVDVEASADAVRRHSDLAAAIEAHNASKRIVRIISGPFNIAPSPNM